MTEQQGCGKNIDGWHRCGVMEMGGSLIYCKGCQPALTGNSEDLSAKVALLRDVLELALDAIPIAGESDKQDNVRFVIMDALEATK